MKWIGLTQGFFAKVSDQDFEALKNYNWHVNRSAHNWYACRWSFFNGRRIKIYMHRQIMGLNGEINKVVNHIDGDSLNNERENLEIVTQDENLRARVWQ